jgi:hypothetical protein
MHITINNTVLFKRYINVCRFFYVSNCSIVRIIIYERMCKYVGAVREG